MSATSSSSTSTNGRGFPTTNGTAPHIASSPSSPSASYERSNYVSHPPVNGYSQVPYPVHNEEIVNHLYLSGFQSGNYADTVLYVHQNSYRLHAIILSRSPYLAHLMSTSSSQPAGQRTIYVHLEQDPEVTQEGFAIAVGYLYSSVSLTLIRPENARGVLAAGCLLGGMNDLCEYAYEVCKRSITVDTINAWVEFIETTPPNPDGTPTSDLPLTSVFGLYAQKLKDHVFHYLVVALPTTLAVNQPPPSPPPPGEASSSPLRGRDVLLQIYSRVPFDMFKAAVESPTFQIGSDQARFKFAKDAIEMRKRGIARGAGAEETVVLAFGNCSGSAVHITRKMRKRPLWKVNA